MCVFFASDTMASFHLAAVKPSPPPPQQLVAAPMTSSPAALPPGAFLIPKTAPAPIANESRALTTFLRLQKQSCPVFPKLVTWVLERSPRKLLIGYQCLLELVCWCVADGLIFLRPDFVTTYTRCLTLFILHLIVHR